MGYVMGSSNEQDYWNAVREKTGVRGEDKEFREEILKRFKLRPDMMEVVEKIRSSGLIVAILSDQTNWLDELDQRTPFHHHFDYVFNSFHLQKTKRDPSIFADICAVLGVRPEEGLFVDDNLENIERAASQGLRAIHFKDVGKFKEEIEALLEIS
jgi:putative hydrolase of the HAD superfamily